MSFMRSSKHTFAARFGRYDRIAQILHAYDSGASLILHHGDANLDGSGGFIPLHAPRRGVTVGARGDYFGAQSGTEDSAGTGIRQSKTHRRILYGLPGFVGDKNSQSMGGSRTGAVNDAFAFNRFQLNDDRGLGRNGSDQGAG